MGLRSRTACYRAAKLGWLPTINLGSRMVVPTAKLRRMLGELPDVEPMSRPTVPPPQLAVVGELPEATASP
jgi:hypothetical protein